MSDITSTEKKRRFIMFCLLGAVIATGIVFASFLLFSPQKTPASAKLAPTRAESVKGQAGGEGSEEYNKKLEVHDQQKASAALAAGESYIPTPVGNKSSVLSKKQDTPPPPPPVAQVRTVPVQPQRTDNTLLKRMMEDLAALDTKLSSVAVNEGKVVFLQDPAKAVSTQTVNAVQTSLPPVQASLAMQPGDMLYAVIDTGVNSDVPSAVMATVASGKYRNARLLGKFQRFEERIVLGFSRIVLESGEESQLEAYAVDPSTSEASVASSVDTHFLSRWGGLIASAFLEGLGEAKRFSGAQSTVYGGGFAGQSSDQMVWNSYSPSEQAWIAAGKVGTKASKIFEKNFERPPTVYLESGTPVGVLVLNVKAK